MRPPAGEKQSWNLQEGDSIAPGRSVVEKLGGGRRYEVYLVWDERLLFLAVAKILRPDRLHDEGARRALEREAELLHRLAHPVLVRGFGAVLDGSHPHVLIEHLDGLDLRRLIKRHGPVPLEQLLPLALDAAAALHYLSLERVVHLDVKPANIVVGTPARLVDLGSARPLESAAKRRTPIGTFAYMAPEQCDPGAAAGGIGAAADIWGLGATVYHAVTGEPPFRRDPDAGDAADPAARYPQLAEAPPPLPVDVPPPLEELLFEMLTPDASDRPTAAEVAEALEPLVADHGTG